MQDKKREIYNFLNKDIKELNRIILALFCTIILLGAGLLSYKITTSYALFSNVVLGEKVIELEVPAIDISITKITLKSSENNGSEVVSSTYTKNKTSMQVSLPYETSTVTYEVRITAPEDKSYFLSNIIEDEYTNSGIKYEIEGIREGNKIEAGTSRIFTIKLYRDIETLENVQTNLVLRYEFISSIESYVVDEYEYINNYDTLVIPYDGKYKLEVWGASGGDCSLTTASDLTKLNMQGGNGGYSSGEMTFTAGENIFIVVGGEGLGTSVAGATLAGGYNGGGKSIGNSGVNHVYGSGGGATHIARKPGLLSSLSSSKDSILIVAGGGGGSRNQPNNTDPLGRYGNGGAGGGLNGIAAIGYGGDGITYVNPVIMGTQNGDENFFGLGEDYAGGGAGGGGYYGGYCGTSRNGVYVGAGDGGSGYIGGVSNGVTIAGNLAVPTFDGSSTMIGNDGNGHAKITFIE